MGMNQEERKKNWYNADWFPKWWLEKTEPPIMSPIGGVPKVDPNRFDKEADDIHQIVYDMATKNNSLGGSENAQR